MGKYMRKSKTTGEVALMDQSPLSIGVRTRAKTLALQRLQQKSAPSTAAAAGGSYLQLRSRRLEKPTILNESKRQKQLPPKERFHKNPSPNSNSKASSRLRVGSGCLKEEEGSQLERQTEKESEGVEEKGNNESVDVGIEASFGENVVEFEGRERGTRETTPCSLLRDPDTVRTPGSTTRPTNSTGANVTVQSSMPRQIPTAHEMDEFFSGAEDKQQRKFIEKYNFDPKTENPLPGRYEWEKVNP